MIKYIRDEPYLSFFLIFALYQVNILFILPMTPLNLAIAYAYCVAYDSFWKGFLSAVAVIFVSGYVAIIFAFLIGRYLLVTFIRKWIETSKFDLA